MIRKIILYLLTIICICSLCVVIKESIMKSQDEAFYESLRIEFDAETLLASDDGAIEENIQTPYEMPTNLVALSDNKNIVGWIRIDDTKIDYPIAQSKSDNEYFLKRDINGNKNTVGSIYLDSISNIDNKGLNIIYGHHMRNGTMFSDVTNFTDPQYLQTHQDITIWTTTQKICLRPVFCYAGCADGSYRQNFTSANEIQDFIKKKTGTLTSSDNIFILITCSYGSKDERTYLICEEI